MVRLMVSGLLYTLANAVGLFLAKVLLPGFSIDFTAFITATVLFTLIEVVAEPLILKISIKNVPALTGGVALVTTFIGLFLTSVLLKGMTIGGLSNWLAATLIVWLGALIAGMLLPLFMFKKAMNKK